MDSLKKAMPVRVQITAILRKALFSGEYKSGDELSLTETAERLGVSRTPVREAFQTLEAEGLIELRMNRGAIVKTIDEKYITDHYEMRILLESEAAKRAAQRGMPDAADYIKKLEALQSHMDSVSTEEYEELNLAVPLRHLDSGRQRAALQIPVQSLERPQRGHCLPEAGPLYQIHSGAY